MINILQFLSNICPLILSSSSCIPQAENRFWHKNCFRCTTCNKPLAVDTYQSHESILYCKPHFKQLFTPKTVLDADDSEVAQKKGALHINSIFCQMSQLCVLWNHISLARCLC